MEGGDAPVFIVIECRQQQILVRSTRVMHAHSVSYGRAASLGTIEALGYRCCARRIRRRNRDAVRPACEGQAREN